MLERVLMPGSKSLTTKIIKTLRKLVAKRGENRIVIITEKVPDLDVRPIFVVGCPRSGTSLVRRILDSHSQIACPPESWFLIPLIGMLDNSKAMRGLGNMGFSAETILSRVRAFANQHFQEYAYAKQKKRWADKNPFYTESLSRIDELFQYRSQFIMLYRHGLDVSYSMSHSLPGFINHMTNYSADKTSPSLPALTASYWREHVSRMRQFQKTNPDRCFELRYESICEEPRDTFRDLFAFLGEPFEDRVLDFHMFPHDAGIEDETIAFTSGIEPSVGNYTRWSHDELTTAIREAEPMLKELNYEVYRDHPR